MIKTIFTRLTVDKHNVWTKTLPRCLMGCDGHGPCPSSCSLYSQWHINQFKLEIIKIWCQFSNWTSKRRCQPLLLHHICNILNVHCAAVVSHAQRNITHKIRQGFQLWALRSRMISASLSMPCPLSPHMNKKKKPVYLYSIKILLLPSVYYTLYLQTEAYDLSVTVISI